jgi:hypothetical protein
MRGHRDLGRVTGAAILCALVAVLVPIEPLRVLAALPLTLFLPGYAITAAAFAPRRIARARFLLLSVAMSLSVLVIGSLLLSAVGIYPGTWALLLVLVVAGACAGAALRRGRAARHARRPGPRRRLARRDLGLLAGATALAVIAIVLAQIPFAAKDAVGYTALWMLPGNNGTSVEVGVANARHVPGPYLLRVQVGKGGGGTTRRFRLDPGEEETFRVAVDVPAGARVTASLYKAGEPEHAYRQVTSWLVAGDSS